MELDVCEYTYAVSCPNYEEDYFTINKVTFGKNPLRGFLFHFSSIFIKNHVWVSQEEGIEISKITRNTNFEGMTPLHQMPPYIS